jgi:hypothetical protein
MIARVTRLRPNQSTPTTFSPRSAKPRETNSPALGFDSNERGGVSHRTEGQGGRRRPASLSYTIGFYKTWNFPEVIIIGRSRATAHHVLDTIATGLEEIRSRDLNKTARDLLPGPSCCFIEVAPRYYADYVGFARWYYLGKPFPLYQIVCPNTDGHYPWSSQASQPFKAWQPVLGPAPKGI